MVEKEHAGDGIPEFDLFLKRLEGQLSLTADENQAIVEELREHLLQQYQGCLQEGMKHEAAVQRCLQEMGVCAQLAGDLARANRWTQLRQRRDGWLMAAMVLGISLLAVYQWWPVPRDLQIVLPPLTSDSQRDDRIVDDQELVDRQLNLPVGQVVAEGMSLGQFLDQTLSQRGVGFQVQSDGISDVRIGGWNYPEVRLATALRFLLRQQSLDYVVKDGLVHVGQRGFADDWYVSKVYTVQATSEEIDQLVDIIQQMLDTRGWERGGGSIGKLGQRLIVWQNPEVHRQLSHLLSSLEVETAGGQKAGEARGSRADESAVSKNQSVRQKLSGAGVP